MPPHDARIRRASRPPQARWERSRHLCHLEAWGQVDPSVTPRSQPGPGGGEETPKGFPKRPRLQVPLLHDLPRDLHPLLASAGVRLDFQKGEVILKLTKAAALSCHVTSCHVLLRCTLLPFHCALACRVISPHIT